MNAAMRQEMQALRTSVESQAQSSRTMDEDEQEEEEDESDAPSETLWGTVLGTPTVVATKPAALSLSSLLCAPPIGASARGGGESQKV